MILAYRARVLVTSHVDNACKQNHVVRVLAMAMDLSVCNLCLESSKQKYRLFENRSSSSRECAYTELGGKLQACTGLSVPNHIQTVCKPCRDAIIQVGKMQLNIQQRVNDIKMKMQSVTGTSTQLGTFKRTLSPTSSTTGLSPAAKRPHPAHAARQLFPRKFPDVSESITAPLASRCRFVPGQLFTATCILPQIVPKPTEARVPLSSQENRVPKPMVVCSSSCIPIQNEITINDSDGTDVTVTISGKHPFKRILAPSVRPIGLALCKGNWRSVASAVMKCDVVRTIIIELILKELNDQCAHLCEKVQFKSILRQSSLDDLLNFTWKNLIDEWKVEAPLFLSFVQAVAAPPRPKNKQKGLTVASRYPTICMGGAVLLKERNKNMSALHQLVGIYLFHGDVHKSEHKRLNKLGLSVSPNVTLTKMDEIGCNYDKEVIEWRDNIVEWMKSAEEILRAISYQIIGDNVDLRVNPTHFSLASVLKEHHWFNLYAVKNRIHGEHLANDKASADVSTLPLATWLPTVDDCVRLRDEFIVLVSRIFVAKFKAFSVFSDVVQDHIPHQYSKEMSEKSHIVPLGVLLKAENKTEDIIDIIEHIQQYTPVAEDGKLQPILFGGDQLTRERATHAQEGKVQSKTPLGRLQGVIPKCEDWHTLVVFNQVIMNNLYKEDSFCQKGTLKQLQNLLQRHKIPKEVKKDFRAVNDFIQLLVDSHVVAAALDFFGMDSLESEPTKNKLPSASRKSDKLKYIRRTVGKFVDKYVLNFEAESSTLLSNEEKEQPRERNEQQRKRSEQQQKRNEQSQKTSGQPQTGSEEDQTTTTKQKDGIFNYACRLLSYGLLSRDFQDATKEGDGQRICCLYKFLMLHFKTNGRTKYALEAFNLTAQINALLTPQLAHQLMWNRMCNTKGGMGKNKELDLHNEHINRVFKDDVNTFRSNLTEHSIARSSHAIGPMMKIIEHFDKVLDVKQEPGQHEIPNLQEDFKLVLNELQREKIFTKKPGRQHNSFKNFSTDPFTSLKEEPHKLQKWLKNRRRIAALDQAMANLKF